MDSFHAPVSTEIYTYCHTLSPHEALPMSATGVLRGHLLSKVRKAEALGPGMPGPQVRPASSLSGRPRSLCATGSSRSAIGRCCPDWRSEEHTSERQSLMRISYAVFCLINKTTTRE